MAYDDIQIHSAPGGGPWILHYPFEASETFGKGDVVSLDQDGQVTEGADELAPEDLIGIAMAGPGGPGASTLTNPRTDAAYADGDRFPVCIPTPTTLFKTQNYTTAGSSYSDTVPAATSIGDAIGLALISGVWGIDLGPGAGSEVGFLVDILNSRGESILDTGETITTSSSIWCIFTIQAHHHGIALADSLQGATA